MRLPILFLINLLRENIYIDGKVVPLINRSYPEERMPCITFDESGGSVTLDKFFYHDKTEKILKNIETTINVHIWCVTEEDRNSILTQIRERNQMCFTDHYEYCTRFQKGTKICETTNKQCSAITSKHVRAVKDKCPNPKQLNYENSFIRFNIDKMNYNMDDSYDIDDMTSKQKTIHSILPVHFVYRDVYDLGGRVIEDVKLEMK